MDAQSKARDLAGDVEEEYPNAEAVRSAEDSTLSVKDKAIWLAGKFHYQKAPVQEVAGDAVDYAQAKHPGDSRMAKAAQANTVLTIVTVAIIAIIGILIYSQVNTSLPNPTNSELNNASTNVTGGFADGMNLLPVVFVVMVAALVIAVVQRFQG